MSMDLTPETPWLKALSDGINRKIHEWSDAAEQWTKEQLAKLDPIIDDGIERLMGMLGGLIGKTGNAVAAPVRKLAGPEQVARSKQPAVEKAPCPISQSVQAQVSTLNLPKCEVLALDSSAVNSCMAYAPNMNRGYGGRGLGL